MTLKSEHELDPLDLSIRARLGRLSPAEERAFAQALETGSALRVAHEVGQDFDVLSRVRSGDEALVERATARALARRSTRPPRRVSRIFALVAAALALASAAAAARAVFTLRSAPAKTALAPPAGTALAARRAPAASELHGRGPGVASAVLPPKAPVQTLPLARRLDANQRAAIAPSAEDGAATLFRQAGAARRAGDFETARSLYGELASRFPASNEAKVSRVSLGKLLLGAGRAREAELEFGKYLRTGALPLREEALVGRADALSALGESSEERNVWQDLLRRHPASVYGTRARERIAAIDRSQSAPAP